MPTIETDLAKYKAAIDFPLQQAATIYPIRDNQIWLGRKIKVGGIGEGYYLGFGGKPEPKDKGRIKATAIRELWEEARIRARQRDLIDMGTAYFYFPFKENRLLWNMQVALYVTNHWRGEPKVTQEMEPKQFDVTKVPYDKMWDDNNLFLPHLLKGKRVEFRALYGKDNRTVLDYSLKFLDDPAGQSDYRA